MNLDPTEPARVPARLSICSISLRNLRMLLCDKGESTTRGPFCSCIALPIVSSIFAFTRRAADSRMNSVRAGSKGTGKSACPAFNGNDRKSFAITSRILRLGVTTVRRIPERRAAVLMINPRPLIFEASNITMSPGRNERSAISASTEDAIWSLAVMFS